MEDNIKILGSIGVKMDGSVLEETQTFKAY